MNKASTSNTPKAFTVSQLNRQVKSLLESSFDFIWVEGEISNFAAPSSGHWYFSLKDGSAQVRCAMFRNRNQRARFTPANGDAIRLRARVSLYEGRGEFQLIVEHLEHAGAGALQLAYDQLKEKLLAEGLFEPERKRALPESIAHMGVITSPTGAAIHDILQVLRRRYPAMAVSILPVAVQGEGAATQISAAIEAANRWANDGTVPLDALIVGRGGGSLEDLWAFNEEVVARAIAASVLPVVSAVGHEVDFSIADMVADIRAPTPSAAAELVSPDQREQIARLRTIEGDLTRLLRRRITESATRLLHLRKRLRHPGTQITENAQRLDDLEQRLLLSQRNLLRRERDGLALLNSQLLARSPLARLRHCREEIRGQRDRLEAAMKYKLQHRTNQLAQIGQTLDALSPLGTLKRGYAIVTDKTGRLVTESGQVSVGDALDVRLAQGQLELTVTKTK